jgi:hypothetical protein
MECATHIRKISTKEVSEQEMKSALGVIKKMTENPTFYEHNYDQNIIDFCLPVDEHVTVNYTRGPYKCIHKVNKIECDICNKICKHRRKSRLCEICSGFRQCEHRVRKYRCKICRRPNICKHNREKRSCFECYEGDDFFCKSGICRNRSTKKWNGFCKKCYNKSAA